MQHIKVVFMGSPVFAVPVLSRLLDAGNRVEAVYTQPDKRSGRGQRVTVSSVKEYALEHDLPVFQPISMNTKDVWEQMVSFCPDVVIVAAYGNFLPAEVLDIPPLGCLNVHPSLLPKYRGPSPVSSAILNGDSVTGVTIIRLDEGMDSGPVLNQKEVVIGVRETGGELTKKLFHYGASLVVDVLPRWARGEIDAILQDDSKSTVTKLLSKEDGEIDWRLTADLIARQVRAYHPWPGTFTWWRGRSLKILEASSIVRRGEESAPPGLVLSADNDSLYIAAGEGVLAVTRVQVQGRQAVSVRDFLHGHSKILGSVIG